MGRWALQSAYRGLDEVVWRELPMTALTEVLRDRVREYKHSHDILNFNLFLGSISEISVSLTSCRFLSLLCFPEFSVEQC
jgi:hypothetical protein